MQKNNWLQKTGRAPPVPPSKSASETKANKRKNIIPKVNQLISIYTAAFFYSHLPIKKKSNWKHRLRKNSEN